jgi:hypothetical protein
LNSQERKSHTKLQQLGYILIPRVVSSASKYSMIRCRVLFFFFWLHCFLHPLQPVVAYSSCISNFSVGYRHSTLFIIFFAAVLSFILGIYTYSYICFCKVCHICLSLSHNIKIYILPYIMMMKYVFICYFIFYYCQIYILPLHVLLLTHSFPSIFFQFFYIYIGPEV